jgi:RimJ/RimL family protein N-acetyltransferase
MAWAPGADRLSLRHFIDGSRRAWSGRSSFNYAIVDAEGIAGAAGLHPRLGPNALEIGYWVAVDRINRGYATAAARALTAAAFDLPGIERVEIHCDEANVRSAAVPRKLGYRLDRVEPDAREAPGEVGRSMTWVLDRPQ